MFQNKYAHIPAIYNRVRALGYEKYHKKGYTGTRVKLGLIDQFDTNHGHMMASYQPIVVPNLLEFKKYNMEKNAVYALRDCIKQAVDDGMHIVSISRSADVDRSDLREVVEYAISKGVILVCSAGNMGEKYHDSVDIKGYPAYYNGTISVVGMANDGSEAKLSSHNKMANTAFFAINMPMLDSKGQESLDRGTSPSTALVADGLALVLDEYIDINGSVPTIEWVEQFIIDNSLDMGEIGHDNLTGWGIFSLDMPLLKQTLIELNDFNGNGLTDYVDRYRQLLEEGKSDSEAIRITNSEYKIIRYEKLGDTVIPIYGGKKSMY